MSNFTLIVVHCCLETWAKKSWPARPWPLDVCTLYSMCVCVYVCVWVRKASVEPTVGAKTFSLKLVNLMFRQNKFFNFREKLTKILCLLCYKKHEKERVRAITLLYS